MQLSNHFPSFSLLFSIGKKSDSLGPRQLCTRGRFFATNLPWFSGFPDAVLVKRGAGVLPGSISPMLAYQAVPDTLMPS